MVFPLHAKQAAFKKGIKQLHGFGFDLFQTTEQVQWPIPQW